MGHVEKEEMMDYATTSEEMVRRIGTIPDEMGTTACFGQPIEKDGHTLIPVARVSFGYGMGFGGGSGGKGVPGEFGADTAEGGEGGGGGGGGGGSSTPVAVIDITRDDVRVTPITDTTRIAMSNLLFAAWAVFWVTLTIRTAVRQRAKVRQRQIDKGQA
jgi:uncharacterized spore protein YtfJ